ncbi:hypothetical protein Rsub_02600 [Raphidocelis subcapitata]|uniref:Actin-related protein 8 n=1 Tax=Raphidocelis subcapitata TaxID=307507 RepID=A0A2V0NQI1_9CHLO|nr:hypothetical protein Rsub_02600 [Raphidocelis subcapitata]|eukprot:GBF89896.1 hypothetical protein Rsub_02600 [Raphidocelis subcapitata]
MQHFEGDVRSLGAAELLSTHGSSLVVFHPGSRTLYIGMGPNAAPIAVAHAVAHWERQAETGSGAPAPAAGEPHQAAAAAAAAAAYYSGKAPGAAALAEASRLLQLQHPLQLPPPPGAQAAGGGARERGVAEGGDGFAFVETAAPEPKPFVKLDRAGEGGVDAQQQGQDQQQPGEQQQQQQQQQQPRAPNPQRRFKGRFVGNEVLRIPPGAPYRVEWPMAGGRLACAPDLAARPDHAVLDDLEEIWGWGLAQLGLPKGGAAGLDAVLVVPQGMTAREVRLLADLLLCRFGFRSLTAHLEPVAATFGAGASAACVVDVGAEGASVVCVEEGVLLQPDPPAAARLASGGDAIARALLALLRAGGAWPEALAPLAEAGAALGRAAGAGGGGGGGGGETESGGGGPSVCRGPGIGGYDLYQITQLRDERCYCPKASTDPGLVGEQLLEDEGPAQIALRSPGAPTRLFSVPTSPWDAVAPLALFVPGLDPASAGAARAGAGAGAGEAAAAAATAAGEDPDAQAGTRPVVLAGLSLSSSSAAAAAVAAGVSDAADGMRGGGDAMEVDGEAPGGGAEAAAAKRARRAGGPPLVDDAPAAERIFLSAQHRALLAQLEEGGGGKGKRKAAAAAAAAVAGDANAAAAGEEQQQDQGGAGDTEAAEAAAPPLPPAAACLLGASEPPPPPGRAALDETVLSCIDAAAGGKLELRQRLLTGILLTGEAGGLRGLQGMLERRVAARVAAQPVAGHGLAAAQPPMVNVLEPKGDPRHTAWRGAAVIACLDSAAGGRDGWLTRRQWAAEGGAAGGGPGRAAAAVNRHARLFAFVRAQQGVV